MLIRRVRTFERRRAVVLCRLVAMLASGLSVGSSFAAEPAAMENAAPLSKTHLERATELIVAQQLAEGCAELQLAYDESRDPMLQLRIARLRQRLGEKEAAKTAYKRYLAEASKPHPALKAEAEEALRTLDPAPPPLLPPPVVDTPPLLPPPPNFDPAAPPPPQLLDGAGEPLGVVRVPRRNKRLMKIGSLLFAAGYLPAFIIPLALSTSLDRENAPSPAANYTLLIPLAGPFVSGIVAPITNGSGHGGQVFSSWSAPWMLTSGLLQVTGFTLLVFGSMKR